MRIGSVLGNSIRPRADGTNKSPGSIQARRTQVRSYRTYYIRTSIPLTVLALAVFLAAALENLRWIFGPPWSLKQRAALAFLLSKARDKRRLRDYLRTADPSRLGHVASQVFLISRVATVGLDVVQDQFEITVEKDGMPYKFRLAPVLRPGASFVHDLYPLTDIFFLRAYDFYPIEGGCVIDVGSYIGDTAVYFAKNRARKIYAYEPNPVNFAYAVANFALNGVSDRIEARNCGIASGTHRLLVPKGAGGAGSMHAVDPEGIGYDVETVPPSSLFDRDETYSLLKVDCKGCEREILRDCVPDLREKVRHMIVEVERLGEPERERVVSVLEAGGFRLDRSDRPFDLLYFSNRSLVDEK